MTYVLQESHCVFLWCYGLHIVVICLKGNDDDDDIVAMCY